MRSKSKDAAADDEDDDVDWGEDVSEAAVQARRMQELSGAVSSMVVTEDLEKTPSERIDIFHAYLKVRVCSFHSYARLVFIAYCWSEMVEVYCSHWCDAILLRSNRIVALQTSKISFSSIQVRSLKRKNV